MKSTKYPCKINDLYSLCSTHSWLQQQAKWRYITDIVQMWANHFARLFKVAKCIWIRCSSLKRFRDDGSGEPRYFSYHCGQNTIRQHDHCTQHAFVNQCIISLTKKKANWAYERFDDNLINWISKAGENNLTTHFHVILTHPLSLLWIKETVRFNFEKEKIKIINAKVRELNTKAWKGSYLQNI